MGSTITFIGVIDWLYEVYTKKKLHAELTELIMGSKSVSDSGIVQFFQDSKDIKFKNLISDSSCLTTIFSYNSRFLEDYEEQITALLVRGGAVEFIFLKNDSKTIALMKSMGWDEASMVSHYRKIERSQGKFASVKNANVRFTYIDTIPRYSAVKLDNSVYLILNTASHERQSVPAVCIKSRSPLWNFLEVDIKKVKEENNVA